MYSLFGDFFTENRLPGDKLERLQALILEQLHSSQDTQELLAAAGVRREAIVKPALRRLKAEIDEEIHALLGDRLFHDYKYATSYRMADSQVSSYENLLRYRGFPALDESQQRALRTAYRSHSYPRIPGREKDMIIGGGFGPEQYGPPLDLKIQKDVRDVLSPAQFSALVEYQRDTRRQQQIYSEVSERTRHPSSASPAP